MQISVFGGLWVAELTDAEIGSRKARTLLAALLLARGAPAPTDRLAEVLWGDTPPERPIDQVGVLVSRLRRDPGRETTELHVRILRGEERPPAGVYRSQRVIGRDTELAWLDRLLRTGVPDRTVVVVGEPRGCGADHGPVVRRAAGRGAGGIYPGGLAATRAGA